MEHAKQIKRALIGLGLLAATNLWSFSGSIQTIDGGKFEGEIRLDKNVFTVKGTNGSLQTIRLEQLTWLRAHERNKSAPPNTSEPASSDDEAQPKRRNVPGLQLTGGSFIARHVHLADDTWIKFTDSPKEAALSTLSVARIYFQPPTPEVEGKLRPGRTGLLLKSNDFIECEFKGISHGKIQVSSVLFGLKSFEPHRVMALALRDPKPAAARFELRTKSDSCLLLNHFLVDKDRLTIQDPTMSGLQITASELSEIRRIVAGN